MIVYADLLFLTSLFFDASVLLMTARLRKLRLSPGRLAAGAVLGAAYVIPMLFPAFGFLYSAAAKAAVSVLIVWLTFGFGSLQRFAGTLGAFYLVQFATAGGVFAVHFLLLSSGDAIAGLLIRPSGAAAFAVETGLWLSVPVFLLSLWLFRSVLQSQSRVELTGRLTADVEVWIGEMKVACRGLIDTGNRLVDPVSGAPVLVMEAGAWAARLPERWLAMIRRGDADLILAEAGEGSVPFAWPDRLRLVPYRAAGGRPQLMLALKPDRIIIRAGDDLHETEKALVALDGGSMDHAGAFQAIVHPMLVTH
jgi:stage II sporulation protein GA (sporulation sigma-E factor processing peptidase)